MSDKARRPLYERRTIKKIMDERGIKYTAALRIFEAEREKVTRREYSELNFEEQEQVSEEVLRRLSDAK